MQELNVGDKVIVRDKSWAFGLDCGNFSFDIPKKGVELTVLKTGLRVKQDHRDSERGICDILVTDKCGNYWFMPGRLAGRILPVHVLVIDGKRIEVSDESFQSLKKQLIG